MLYHVYGPGEDYVYPLDLLRFQRNEFPFGESLLLTAEACHHASQILLFYALEQIEFFDPFHIVTHLTTSEKLYNDFSCVAIAT